MFADLGVTADFFIVKLRHQRVNEIIVLWQNALKRGFALSGEKKLITAAVRRVIRALDEAVSLHGLHDTGRVALGAEHQVRKLDIVNAGMVAEMQEDVETGQGQIKFTEQSLLMVVNMQEDCLERIV